VVADASVLPSSIGVNPQETIIALALRQRRALARGARSCAAPRRRGPIVMPLFSRPTRPWSVGAPRARIMPFLMPSRNGAFVLFEQEVAAEPARAGARAAERRPAARGAITLFHLVLRAIGLALAEFPRLNRFRRRQPALPAARHLARLQRQAAPRARRTDLHQEDLLRPGERSRRWSTASTPRSARAAPGARRRPTADQPLPAPAAPVLRLGVRLVRRLDAWGLLPASFSADDPLYASAFVANLGSVGLDAAYHHLFEYGTIPIFVTIGRLRRAPVVRDDGSVGKREVFTLRYTYDERIEDGFYAARALERLQALLEVPERLDAAPPTSQQGG